MPTGRERLSEDDAQILALESAAIAGHTLKLIVLEPGAEGLDAQALRALVAARLDRVPRARQRVECRDGERPRWEEDPDFDLANQIRERPLPAGGDREALWRSAGEIMAERLEHSRPLWALDLLGPLDGGRQAIVARIHHAMADGISCVRFLDALLWDEQEAKPRGAVAGARAAAPGGRGNGSELVHMPAALWRELTGHASRSPLDRRIGAGRAIAFAEASLADLKAIAHSRPGHVTINDVLLAVVAGGLSSWLGDGGSRLPHLRAQIPVSLHHRDETEAEVGNRDSFLNVDLPLAEGDPLRRLERINAETAKRKRLGDADEIYDFFHALGCLPGIGGALGRLASGPHEFSLSISNVPGPRAPLTIGRRRVTSLGSVAEPAQRHALRVAALSCAGTLAIGLCTDPEALPGVERLAGAIEGSLAELRAAAIG